MRVLSGVLTLASIVALVFEHPGWCLGLAGGAFAVYWFFVPRT